MVGKVCSGVVYSVSRQPAEAAAESGGVLWTPGMGCVARQKFSSPAVCSGAGRRMVGFWLLKKFSKFEK